MVRHLLCKKKVKIINNIYERNTFQVNNKEHLKKNPNNKQVKRLIEKYDAPKISNRP